MLVEEFRLDFQGVEGGGGAFVEDEVVAAVWHDFVCVGDVERFEAFVQVVMAGSDGCPNR